MERETFISEDQLQKSLALTGSGQAELLARADSVRKRSVSANVYYRGIIEFSNVCANDCFYCGIRNSNRKIGRYTMSEDEILDAAGFCRDAGYASVVLQSGERRSEEFTGFVESILKAVSAKYPELRITLSVGEQDRAAYERFFAAGAGRYLLRIETSDAGLYGKLHPGDMSHDKRLKCLKYLRETGFQVGTGVMIGLPGQNLESLARDLLFMRDEDVDMVGMGPYLPHRDAALGEQGLHPPDELLGLSLNMIALLRLMMPDINIAATTAFQALDPEGREKALKAGANVIMPLVTPEKYRSLYTLYDGKPCAGETASECLDCITGRIKSTGLIPAFGEWGDSLRFLGRRKKCLS